MDLDHLIERLEEPELVEPEGLIETFARAGGGATLGLRIFDAENPTIVEQ